MKSPFTYEIPASAERIGELHDTLSPLETPPDGLSRDDFIAASLAADASYAVLIDGRLAGVALVRDFPDRREMGFAKTEYLTTSRRLTFARHVRTLIANLNFAESRRLSPDGSRHADLTPLVIHTPQDDDRSRDWFIRAGCTPLPDGLACPTYTEEF